MKPFRHNIIIVWIVASFIALANEQLPTKEGVGNQAIAGELQLLQGTWEGVASHGKIPLDGIDGPDLIPGEVEGNQSREKITIRIKGNSFHFHRDTNFWFDTTITLPTGTDPKQLHATSKRCPPSQADSIGKVVGAIFKIEDGTLTLADYAITDEPPKTFADATSRYVLKKVQPKKENVEPSKTK